MRQQVISASGERAAKRAAPDSPETQTKKIMVNHSSCEEQVSSLGLMSSDQPRFVNAASIVANARTNVQMIPEISDKELLEMAIQFEMKHPQ
jgi:hypothetical protein